MSAVVISPPEMTGTTVKNMATWTRKLVNVAFVTTSCLTLLMLASACYHIFARVSDMENPCRMTYMRPHYHQIPLLPSGFEAPPQSNTSQDVGSTVTSGLQNTFRRILQSEKAGRSRLAHKYRLFRFINGVAHEGFNPLSPDGYPVLFVPGSMGSYGQVRAIAAHSSTKVGKGSVSLDFYSMDYEENPSGLSGYFLWQHAEYMNDCIATILNLYTSDNTRKQPRQVIILAHSMGGVVARLAPLLPNYVHDSIRSIVSLSTPHVRPVVVSDWHMRSAYSQMNEIWRLSLEEEQWQLRNAQHAVNKVMKEAKAESNVSVSNSLLSEEKEVQIELTEAVETQVNTEGEVSSNKNDQLNQKNTENSGSDDEESTTKNDDESNGEVIADPESELVHNSRQHKIAHAKLRSIVLTSIAGGYRDFIVPSNAAAILPDSGVISHRRAFSTLSSLVPKVAISTDHLAILWCNQLVDKLAVSMQKLATYESSGQTLTKKQEEQVKLALEQLYPSIPDDFPPHELVSSSLEHAKVMVADQWEDVLRRRELLVNELLHEFPIGVRQAVQVKTGHSAKEYAKYAPEFLPEALMVDILREHYPGLFAWLFGCSLLLLAELSRVFAERSYQSLEKNAETQSPIQLFSMLYPWQLISEVWESARQQWKVSQLFRHLTISGIGFLILFQLRNFIGLTNIGVWQSIEYQLFALTKYVSVLGVDIESIPNTVAALVLLVVAISVCGLILVVFSILRRASHMTTYVASRSNTIAKVFEIMQQSFRQLWRSLLLVAVGFYPVSEAVDYFAGNDNLGWYPHFMGVITGLVCMTYFVTLVGVVGRLVYTSVGVGIADDVVCYRYVVGLTYVPLVTTMIPVVLQCVDLLRPRGNLATTFVLHTMQDGSRATLHTGFPVETKSWNDEVRSQFLEYFSQALPATRHQVQFWELAVPVLCVLIFLVVTLHLHSVESKLASLQPKVMDMVWGPIEFVEVESDNAKENGTEVGNCEERPEEGGENAPNSSTPAIVEVEVDVQRKVEQHSDTQYVCPSEVIQVSGERIQVDTIEEVRLPKQHDRDAVPLIVLDAEIEFNGRRTRQRTLTRRIRAGTSVMPTDPMFRWWLRFLSLISFTIVGESAPNLMMLSMVYTILSISYGDASNTPQEKTVTTIERV